MKMALIHKLAKIYNIIFTYQTHSNLRQIVRVSWKRIKKKLEKIVLKYFIFYRGRNYNAYGNKYSFNLK